MSVAPEVIRTKPTESANERLKSRFGAVVWGSILFVAALEFVVFRFAPGIRLDATGMRPTASTEMRDVGLPSEMKVPPPPARAARPATPVLAPANLGGDLTIPLAAFKKSTVAGATLPTSLPELHTPRIADKVRWVRPNTHPRMLNETEVAQAMAAAYPQGLCGAGIGGTVRLVLYLTEGGSVERAKIRESSGYEQLDEVALSVASLYRFSPAITWDERLPVSVVVTVRFKVATSPRFATEQNAGGDRWLGEARPDDVRG